MLRPRFTYANVIATIALFIALGGVGYATGVIPPANSVGASQIKTNAVGSAEIAPSAVHAADMATGSVGAAQLRAGAVGAADLMKDAVGEAQLKPQAVGTTELKSGAVGEGQLKEQSVGAAQLKKGVVEADNLTASAMSALAALASPPGGSAGGALTGAYPNPTLVQDQWTNVERNLGQARPNAIYFQGSWNNLNAAGDTTGGFVKDGFGFVHLKGMLVVSASSQNNVFVLPTGYRPPKNMWLLVATGTGTMRTINIDSTGQIAVVGTINNGDQIALDGVSFRTDQN